MAIFILGPSRNKKGTTSPLEIRRALKNALREIGTRAIIMEDHEDRPGENNLAKFQRIFRKEPLISFIILVPLKSRLHGVSVEIGHLLTRIQDGDLNPARVHLALQSQLTRIDEQGLLALHEAGNRTRYYEDLLDEGCPIHRWTDFVELKRHAVAIAMEESGMESDVH